MPNWLIWVIASMFGEAGSYQEECRRVLVFCYTPHGEVEQECVLYVDEPTGVVGFLSQEYLGPPPENANGSYRDHPVAQEWGCW